ASPYPQCIDRNECDTASRCGRNLSASNVCTNQTGGYDCTCTSGFQLANDETTSETCADIDECALYDPCLASTGRTTGTNDNRSYGGSCHCSSYACSATPYPQCVDIPECATASRCGRNLSALNTCIEQTGGYDCACAAGFVLTGNETTS